jgi:hypothetical protein
MATFKDKDNTFLCDIVRQNACIILDTPLEYKRPVIVNQCYFIVPWQHEHSVDNHTKVCRICLGLRKKGRKWSTNSLAVVTVHGQNVYRLYVFGISRS